MAAKKKVKESVGIRTFDLIVYVTGWLDGGIKDWPVQIQDRIWEALERKAHEVELPLTIIESYCDVDYGEAVDRSQDRFFLRCIASEIVVKDARWEDPAYLKEQFDKLIKGDTNGTIH